MKTSNALLPVLSCYDIKEKAIRSGQANQSDYIIIVSRKKWAFLMFCLLIVLQISIGVISFLEYMTNWFLSTDIFLNLQNDKSLLLSITIYSAHTHTVILLSHSNYILLYLLWAWIVFSIDYRSVEEFHLSLLLNFIQCPYHFFVSAPASLTSPTPFQHPLSTVCFCYLSQTASM